MWLGNGYYTELILALCYLKSFTAQPRKLLLNLYQHDDRSYNSSININIILLYCSQLGYLFDEPSLIVLFSSLFPVSFQVNDTWNSINKNLSSSKPPVPRTWFMPNNLPRNEFPSALTHPQRMTKVYRSNECYLIFKRFPPFGNTFGITRHKRKAVHRTGVFNKL